MREDAHSPFLLEQMLNCAQLKHALLPVQQRRDPQSVLQLSRREIMQKWNSN